MADIRETGMAETGLRQTGGSAVARHLPWALPEGLLSLSEPPRLWQIELRLRPPVPAYIGGLPMPLEPNRVASMQTTRILWLAPDEFLVTAPQSAAPDLPVRLQRAVARRSSLVLDQSAARVAIEITGLRARDLLAKGCGLDLHPRGFTSGQCAQTLFARLPIILDQIGEAPVYRLFVRRSAARWLSDWLIDAAAEFRPVR